MQSYFFLLSSLISLAISQDLVNTPHLTLADGSQTDQNQRQAIHFSAVNCWLDALSHPTTTAVDYKELRQQLRSSRSKALPVMAQVPLYTLLTEALTNFEETEKEQDYSVRLDEEAGK
ncbi:hypothetical protein [Candidatus Odyssella thessalonicensis]|uniref:hypothetical protein n=1 Tax=Candidatus Odyssella thessalonicensis TaxID=84647 RepID=UPI000225ACA3|nr:hypothetical protein [Candidatus Odyssella thessalonicensis]